MDYLSKGKKAGYDIGTAHAHFILYFALNLGIMWYWLFRSWSFWVFMIILQTLFMFLFNFAVAFVHTQTHYGVEDWCTMDKLIGHKRTIAVGCKDNFLHDFCKYMGFCFSSRKIFFLSILAKSHLPRYRPGSLSESIIIFHNYFGPELPLSNRSVVGPNPGKSILRRCLRHSQMQGSSKPTHQLSARNTEILADPLIALTCSKIAIFFVFVAIESSRFKSVLFCWLRCVALSCLVCGKGCHLA